MIAGAFVLACSNRSRTRLAPTPTNISTKSEPEIEKNGTPASPATARASRVLPVPGGPNSRTPLGIFAPTAWNFTGFCRKSLISCSSSTASSAPATSENVVLGVSLVTCLALDLPKAMTPRPPPCMELNSQNSSRSSTMNGRKLTRIETKTLSCVTVVSNLTPSPAALSPVPETSAKTSSDAPSGYDAVTFDDPSTGFFSSRLRVCSLSLIVAWSTFPSWSCSRAVEVWTSWYPPLPRNREENATATRTTRTTQNHTDRKSFLRSIHRDRAAGRARLPVDPPDRPGTPPATRAGTPARGSASSSSTVHRGCCAFPARRPWMGRKEEVAPGTRRPRDYAE